MSCRTVGRHLVSVQTSHPATVGFEVTKVSQGGQAYGSTIMEVSGGCPGIRDCVTITFLSFRASEARHGIQYFQYVLDTGLRRYDDFYCAFRHYDTVSFAGVPCAGMTVFVNLACLGEYYSQRAGIHVAV